MAKGAKKAKRSKERLERRFVPVPSTSPALAKTLGGVGAAALGAGGFAQFGHAVMGSELPPYSFAPALLAAGAVLFGAAVWLGTSAEPALRVGAGGVGFEKGKEVVRVPWCNVERVLWDSDRRTLSVHGKDETGGDQRVEIAVSVQPAAVAWAAKEGKNRIPALVDVPDEALGVPRANDTDGQLLIMDPVQVVGRRCASSDRVIAYEPDARVCPRCERVYYKLEVPEECACGARLEGLRDAAEPSAAVSS